MKKNNPNVKAPTQNEIETFQSNAVDMLGKKSVGKINYKDITFLKEIKDIPGFEGTLEELNELTILK